MQYKLMNNEKKNTIVTNKIFEDMQVLLKNRNIKLIILNLADNKEALNPYLKTFKNKDIDFINCNIKQTEDLSIKGDGHPNHIMHSLYSNCIYQNLKKFIY